MIKGHIINSVYVKFLREKRNIILVSFALSVFLTILTYPGILYSDSYGRVQYAHSFRLWLHNIFAGNTDLVQDRVWLTLIPSYFIYLSIKYTGSIVLYTFTQCFLFYFTVFVFITNLVRSKWIYGCICIVLTPVFAAYSVYYEAGVGCAAAIVWILLLIWKWDGLNNPVDKIVSVILLIFASFLAFGYRANAFTILPAAILIILCRYGKKLKSPIMAGCIFLGLIFVSLFPKIMHIDTMSSYAAGFVWEIVATIQNMEDTKIEFYDTYLDDIFGEGVTLRAVEVNSQAESASWNICPLLEVINSGVLSEPEATKKALEKYIHLAKEEPQLFMANKWNFIAGTMGFHTPLKMVEYDYNRWGSMSSYGFNDCRQRKIFVDFFLSYMEFMKIFRTPWIMFLIAFFCLIGKRLRNKTDNKKLTLNEAVFLTAIFYYGAFILNNQSFEFRYFFPSWLLLFFVITATVFEVIESINFKANLMYCVFYTILSAGLFGGYIKLTESGDAELKNIMENILPIYAENGQTVYYDTGKLYFVFDANADKEYQIFLHYFTSEGDMINNDFQFKSACQYTSFWNKRMAVKEIPMQSFNTVEFGQYYGATRFWEYSCKFSEFLPSVESISVLDFNGEGWTNGYSNSEYCFLADKMDLANFLLIGKKLILPDGGTMNITKVENVNNYQRIYTDGDISGYKERNYKIEY